jgi:non-heme chloroperoxidase
MGFSMPEGELRQIHETTPEGHVGAVHSNPAVQRAMIAGQQKHTEIRVPVLAIFALPHSPGRFAESNPVALAAYESSDLVVSGAQVASFEAGVPNSRVVRMPHANHYVFLSNETDVLREMRSFLEGLL